MRDSRAMGLRVYESSSLQVFEMVLLDDSAT
jgi:hypothetical protein